MAIVESIAATERSRRKIVVKNPANLELIGEVIVASREEVLAKVARAREAQKTWALVPVKKRAQVLTKAIDVVMARQDELIDIIRRETGRSAVETLMMEILSVCDMLNHYAKTAQQQLEDRTVSIGALYKLKKLQISYRPLGVVAVITPWNGPFVMGMNPTAQAIVAGNAVIVKPSEVTPFAGALVEEVFRAAGAPDGLVQVVSGDGEVGRYLLEARPDKVSFTGSTATGRKVGEFCGRELIPVTLELGGKDPMIVCGDADIERAAGGAVFGAMFNTGQYCSSLERCYVVESVADAFIEHVVREVKTLKLGSEGLYDIAPMIWDKQLEKVDEQVKDAVTRGAKVLAGGKRVGPHFEPTVLVDVTHDMRIMREETFGPVLPIVRVRDEEHALQLANDCEYGLSATVWSKDVPKAVALAKRVEAGNLTVNDSAFSYGIHQAPFGGVKASGVGQVHGENALRRYAYETPIVIDRFGPKREGGWYPYDEKKYKGMKKALQFLFGTPLRRLL
jgi:succinate-semialdehyde dehydrogenase/glutarate-semialdehyde dehydrogenase